jgi:hypothetical protein
MKKIKLTKGMVALVSDEDYPYLSQWKWHAEPFGNTWAAVRNRTGKAIYMHRAITGAGKGKVVDHINGNGLDNRRENIRVCTQQENVRNRQRGKNNTTGFKGVSRFDENKYQVKIRVNGKLKHLGLFTSVYEAAEAYDKAAVHYFGEFARINFPDRQPPTNRRQFIAPKRSDSPSTEKQERDALNRERRRTLWENKQLVISGERTRRSQEALEVRMKRLRIVQQMRDKNMTLKAIGGVIGVSRERVRQLLDQILAMDL